MDSRNEVKSAPRFDSLLLLASLSILIGALGAYYYLVDQFNPLYRTGGLLAAIALSLALAYQTELGRTIWSYITGSRTELRKVVWPSRQETIQSTIMIAVVVLITALFLWGLDSLLLWGVSLLTGRS